LYYGVVVCCTLSQCDALRAFLTQHVLSYILYIISDNIELSVVSILFSGMSVVEAFMVEEVFVARVARYGRVTIPLRVRDVLSIREGDYIRMTVTEIVKKKGKLVTSN